MTTAMEPIPPGVAERRLRAAEVVHDVFAAMFPADRHRRSPHGAVEKINQGLETSRWAPRSASALSAASSARFRGRPQTGSRSLAHVGEQSARRGLEESMWAPKKGKKGLGTEVALAPTQLFTLSSSSPPLSPPTHHQLLTSHNTSSIPEYSLASPSHVPSDLSYIAHCAPSRAPSKQTSMYRPANLDDTAGFMAAARALRENAQANALSLDKNTPGSQNDLPKSVGSRVGSPTAPEFVPSASSSVAGNPGDFFAEGLNDFPKRSSSFVGSPTASEFVPSSPSSLDGNHGGSQADFLSVVKAKGGNPKTPGFDPAAEEFIPSSAASSYGSNTGTAPAAKEMNITDFDFQKAIRLDSFGSKAQPVISAITASSNEKGDASNVDDTIGFMAAARALRQARETTAASDPPASSGEQTVEQTVEPIIEGQASYEQFFTPVTETSGFPAADREIPREPSPVAFTSNAEEPVSPHAVEPSYVEATFGSSETAEQPRRSVVVPPTIDEPTAAPSSSKVANVDDIAGFMAAARSLRRIPGMPIAAPDEAKPSGSVNEHARFMDTLQEEQPTPSPTSPAFEAKKVHNSSKFIVFPGEDFVSSTTSPEKTINGADGTASSHTIKFSRPVHSTVNGAAYLNGADTAESTSAPTESTNGVEPQSLEKRTNGVNDTPGFLAAVRALKNKRTGSSSMSIYASQQKSSDENGSPQAPHPSATAVEDEDRENLITFKSWGTPAPRQGPTAQVRRIVLTGLPSTWATPTKVCSLIHGGAIEKVSISPNGAAYVYFCDHEACKAFYEKYPNGIGLGPNNVYVDIGDEVDVVSSQLAVNRSMGATRVVRAVGVDMNITMFQLHQIASGSNRKIEKIVDNYVPNEIRTVHFRFCSIDDAVRFRSMLVRDVDWETCNVQYGKDPCELAPGFHMD